MQKHEGRSLALLRPEEAGGRLREAAQARDMRRALEQAADHGIALLEALGLPRLVTADFVPINPSEVGDAVDAVISALDEADAPAEDLEDGGDVEPSLGWIARVGQGFLATGGTADLERDTADWEPSLASPERHPAVPLGPFYRAFTERSPDDRQTRWADGAQHDGEAVDEDGDEIDAGEFDTADDEPSLGRPEAIDQCAWNCGRTDDAELDPLDDIETGGPGPGPHASKADLFTLTERAKAMRRRIAAQHQPTPNPIGASVAPVGRTTGAVTHA